MGPVAYLGRNGARMEFDVFLTTVGLFARIDEDSGSVDACANPGWNTNFVFFESVDCSGQPYVWWAAINNDPVFLALPRLACAYAGQLWTAASMTGSSISACSRLDGGAACAAISGCELKPVRPVVAVNDPAYPYAAGAVTIEYN